MKMKKGKRILPKKVKRLRAAPPVKKMPKVKVNL